MYDYASDVVVLKLCNDTIGKLFQLIETGEEDPQKAMCLYFQRAFLCALNANEIILKDKITMLWTSLMWFTYSRGISMTNN